MPPSPAADPMATTIAAYASPGAAAAYLARAAAHARDRDASSRGLAGNMPMAGARCLDLGCGPGDDVSWMLSRGAHAVGVDASAGMLALAEARHGRPGAWLRADLRHLGTTPWGSESCLDLVWSMMSLVHVERDLTPGLLTRWASWLRPGGRIALATKAGTGEVLGPPLTGEGGRTMVLREPGELVLPLLAAGLDLVAPPEVRPSLGNPAGERIVLLSARRAPTAR